MPLAAFSRAARVASSPAFLRTRLPLGSALLSGFPFLLLQAKREVEEVRKAA